MPTVEDGHLVNMKIDSERIQPPQQATSNNETMVLNEFPATAPLHQKIYFWLLFNGEHKI
jgi:hypothetical protein